jgi:putative redox protein
MSVRIQATYQGDLHCEAVHGPSQAHLSTDAPADNQGRGESFSPTDLVATAMGTCMLTVMGIFAKRHDIDLTGTTVSVEKEMVQQPIRRISKLAAEIHFPLPADHPQREALERCALTCPVHQSLSAEVEKPVKFVWEG